MKEHIVKINTKELDKLVETESRKRFWSEEELDILRKYYPQLGGANLVKYMNGKNRIEICHKASAMGMKYLYTGKEGSVNVNRN